MHNKCDPSFKGGVIYIYIEIGGGARLVMRRYLYFRRYRTRHDLVLRFTRYRREHLLPLQGWSATTRLRNEYNITDSFRI